MMGIRAMSLRASQSLAASKAVEKDKIIDVKNFYLILFLLCQDLSE